MNNFGFIYVLANSSMPDLVKVGKTTRQPSQRAQELSGVSGIPTPFIVVYEQAFEDCTDAEEYLHTILKQKGYRETNNREFFRAPVNEIIHIISKMPGQISGPDVSSNELSDDDELTSNQTHDELDDLLLEHPSESYPWSSIWEAAENYRYGFNDCIQDYDEAMKLYREAAKLGCLMAYERLGLMYKYGESVPESDQKALEYFKTGARKGNYKCYLEMAALFLSEDHQDNYSKCVRLFLRAEKSG